MPRIPPFLPVPPEPPPYVLNTYTCPSHHLNKTMLTTKVSDRTSTSIHDNSPDSKVETSEAFSNIKEITTTHTENNTHDLIDLETMKR